MNQECILALLTYISKNIPAKTGRAHHTLRLKHIAKKTELQDFSDDDLTIAAQYLADKGLALVPNPKNVSIGNFGFKDFRFTSVTPKGREFLDAQKEK